MCEREIDTSDLDITEKELKEMKFFCGDLCYIQYLRDNYALNKIVNKPTLH